MSALDMVKRAPKGAVLISAGIAGGAVIVYTVKHRDKPAPDGSTDAVTDTTGDQPYQMWDSSPVPGIVVPPVVTGGSSDGPTSIDTGLASLFMGGFENILGTLTGAFETVQADNHDITAGNQSIVAGLVADIVPTLTGGGAPTSPAPVGAVAPSGAQVAQPPPAPTPASRAPTAAETFLKWVAANGGAAPRHSPNDTFALKKDAPRGYPYHSARGWYKTENKAGGHHFHVYSNGYRLEVKND